MNKDEHYLTENKQILARRVVDKMLANDPYSRWLGIEVLEVLPGKVQLQMTVRPEMLNGFGVCHGGVTFSFADSALAFASNSHGRVSLLLKASMSYPEKVAAGDVLTAKVEEESLSHKVGMYSITVLKNNQQKVGIFHGTVYRTGKPHFPESESEEV